ncbi:MAG: ATP-dependent Clp protease proteolytic subunit [Nitrospirae bacterium YQR-1]
MQIFDKITFDSLNGFLARVEEKFVSDVIFYYGQLHPAYLRPFKDFIERLKNDPKTKIRLVIFLNTPGGSVEAVEYMVRIIRFHYDEVYFVIPDAAFSAGTIFCMSGDKIYMDYSSSLGPIDPQVYLKEKDTFVPALGYLDKVDELIKKSNNGTLSPAEFALLQSQDLAMLRSYEQAKELTIKLLEEWLVKYKFKDWTEHGTNQNKKGMPVTDDEKRKRAVDIASALGNNTKWLSHGRYIGIDFLRYELKLKIEDFSTSKDLKEAIKDYNDIICEYVLKNNIPVFFHSRILY